MSTSYLAGRRRTTMENNQKPGDNFCQTSDKKIPYDDTKKIENLNMVVIIITLLVFSNYFVDIYASLLLVTSMRRCSSYYETH